MQTEYLLVAALVLPLRNMDEYAVFMNDTKHVRFFSYAGQEQTAEHHFRGTASALSGLRKAIYANVGSNILQIHLDRSEHSICYPQFI
jgi:hypothetical protein